MTFPHVITSCQKGKDRMRVHLASDFSLLIEPDAIVEHVGLGGRQRFVRVEHGAALQLAAALLLVLAEHGQSAAVRVQAQAGRDALRAAGATMPGPVT